MKTPCCVLNISTTSQKIQVVENPGRCAFCTSYKGQKLSSYILTLRKPRLRRKRRGKGRTLNAVLFRSFSLKNLASAEKIRQLLWKILRRLHLLSLNCTHSAAPTHNNAIYCEEQQATWQYQLQLWVLGIKSRRSQEEVVTHPHDMRITHQQRIYDCGFMSLLS